MRMEIHSSYEISVLCLKMKQDISANEKALVAACSKEHANVTSYF